MSANEIAHRGSPVLRARLELGRYDVNEYMSYCTLINRRYLPYLHMTRTRTRPPLQIYHLLTRIERLKNWALHYSVARKRTARAQRKRAKEGEVQPQSNVPDYCEAVVGS